ncbi:MAG: hypothetical protein LBJ46_08940 [Planctomycetota bacterium]|nr:hypothetical protein [Planctomycetota bacterium]
MRIVPPLPLLLACALALPGCPGAEPSRPVNTLSLVEIGERALENGERQEAAGRRDEARESYRRALWAFRYHERLTGEQPLLLDEAVRGANRASGRRR